MLLTHSPTLQQCHKEGMLKTDSFYIRRIHLYNVFGSTQMHLVLGSPFIVDERQTKYFTTIENICKVPLIAPDIQRAVCQERVAEIVEFQREHFNAMGCLLFIGEITLVSLNGSLYIVDGLHRCSSFKQVWQLQPNYRICVNCIACTNVQEMIDVFTIINQAVPVANYIIQTTLDVTRRKKLDEFKDAFCRTWKCYVSSARSPHRPNVNIDTVINAINEHDNALMLDCFGSGLDFFEYFKYVNVYWLQGLDIKNTEKSNAKALKQGCDPLYITNDVDYDWMGNNGLLDGYVEWCGGNMGGNVEVANEQANEQLNEQSNEQSNVQTNDGKNADISAPSLKRKRKTLPKAIRSQVWRNEFSDSMNGSCPLCNCGISFEHFDCGHIVSHKNGGTDETYNLRPICGKCNRSMSAMNMDEYCQRYGIAYEVDRYMDIDTQLRP